MVNSSSPYDWLSIDHYCWYSFPQYYDSICQWKLNCCQTFPTKLTAQHSERASFMTQANKASFKHSSLLPICGKFPLDLFLTFAITYKGFPVLSVEKFCEAIFNAFTVFSYSLWKSHTAISRWSVWAGAYRLQNVWRHWAKFEESCPAHVHKYLLKFCIWGSGNSHIMRKAWKT